MDERIGKRYILKWNKSKSRSKLLWVLTIWNIEYWAFSMPNRPYPILSAMNSIEEIK